MIILDTETTGLDEDAEICEIAMLDGEGRVLLETLIKPTKPIPADAIRIHKITNEMVADAPTWKAIQPQFKKLIKGKQLHIYNAEYDLRILRQTAIVNKCAFAFLFARVSGKCVMLKYAEYYGEKNKYREGWKWHKLQSAARQCNVKVTRTHRALADCRMTLGVMKYMNDHPKK